MSERTIIACKDCGQPVYVTAAARLLDIARNLSAPERCPKCRKKNRDEINSVGQSYWHPKIETDDRKRCWGKRGLSRLVHERPEPRVERYTGIPVDLPLKWLRNPNDPTIPCEYRGLAEKFSKIAPVAEKLVANLIAPDGKRVSVLVGPTGTGKSTWVPYRLLRSPIGEQGRIVVTQPRTITLRQDPGSDDPTTTPGYIAACLMGLPAPWLGPGQEIGFQYSGVYDQKDAYTRLLFVTDGTLINWIQSGEIGDFAVVVVDEAHEQSVNMELIFALLKHRMALYPHLKIVIASATVDIDRFRNYFGNGDPNSVFLAAPDDAQSLATGTPKLIHDRFMTGSEEPEFDFAQSLPEVQAISGLGGRDRLARIPSAVAALIRAICTKPDFTCLDCPQGDILVFVPRIDDVDNVCQAVESLSLGLEVFPCHAQLSGGEYERYRKSDKAAARAMAKSEPTRPQRVVVATTYAETSVTMSNLRYVIDSGLILQPVWDPETCSTKPEVRWHSQDGCKQRKGRVGRVQDGECFRLYTKAEHNQFPIHTPPEITRVPLDFFFLKAKAAGIDDLTSFDWLGKPQDTTLADTKEIKRASEILRERGVIDDEGDVTHRGIELAGFQTNTVDLALCMSESDAFACTLEMATFLAFLQPTQKPFARGDMGALAYVRWRKDCYDDLELYLRLFHHWASFFDARKRNEWFESQGVNASFLSEVEAGREGLIANISRRTHDRLSCRALDLKRLHRVRLILARCIPEWIYVKDPESGVFRPYNPDKCPCSEPVRIDKNSSCLALRDLEAFICIGRTKNTKGIFAQHIVRLHRDYVRHIEDSPLALAVMLRDSLAAERDVAEAASQHVQSLPAQPTLPRYAANQRVAFRVIKPVTPDDDDEAGRAYLCEDVETGQAIVVGFDTEKDLQPGATFQAVPTLNQSQTRIQVTQQPIIDEFKDSEENQRGIKAVVINQAQDREGQVYGLNLSLPQYGLQGLLHQNNMGYVERSKLLRRGIGETVEVVATGSSNDKVTFTTIALVRGRARRFVAGEVLTGTVIAQSRYGENHDRAGQLRGLRVEVVAGRNGFLPLSALGTCAQDRLDALTPGVSIKVEVNRVPMELHKELPLRLPTPTFDVGKSVTGVVVELASYTLKYGYALAVIELAPNVEGRLHWRQAPRGFLNSVREGQTLSVRIVGRDPDGKYELAR